MKLDWYHNQEEGFLECVLDSNVSYRTYNGGDDIDKIENGKITKTFSKQYGEDHELSWEKEKHWISEVYTDEYGVYEPLPIPQAEMMESWLLANPDWKEAFPAFGVYENQYLDRLQRPSSVQIGLDMHNALENRNDKIKLDYDPLTKKLYKREWCEEEDNFYNVQPCCVFPNNPGRIELSESEKQELVKKYNLSLG